MRHKIYLDYNYGYKWSGDMNCYIKGYAFLGGKLLKGKNFINEIKKVKKYEELKNLLKKLNGLFSGIFILKDRIFLFTDKVRTFPLFYFKKGDEIIITDNTYNLYPYTSLDEYRIKEFLATGYATCEYTLLKDVYQVQAGEIVEIDLTNNKINKEFYFEYLTNFVVKEDYEVLKNQFLKILENVFLRTLKIVDGHQVVIPLSGGYDSRLIAVMLKKLGYENVICYTYGKKNSFEVKTSKRVAEKLGFKWLFVEYNEQNIPKHWYKENLYRYYEKFAFNFVSLPHIQDFFAVKFLKDKNILKEDSIIIPGHSGDFIAGSHIRNLTYTSSMSEIKEEILNTHYCLNKTVIDSRSFSICNINKEKYFAYSIYENWDLKNRQAKFIVNANRVYEFMGFKHLIPLWDSELIEFFRVLPLELKLNQKFYEDVLLNTVFKRYAVNYKKKGKKISNFFVIKLIKNYLKNFPLVTLLYSRLMDVNNFAWIAKALKEELERYNVRFNLINNDINSILAQYIIYNIIQNNSRI